MTFAQKLKLLRSEHNLSQDEIASKIGVSRAAVGHWENGIRSPKIGQIIKIASIVGINWLDLVDDDDAEAFESVVKDDKQYLADVYQKLNAEGRQILITFAESLSYNPAYKTNDN